MKAQCGRQLLTASSMAVALSLGFVGPAAWANLGSSDFDTTDGNLKVEAGDTQDWAGVIPGEIEPKADVPSGTGDDAFGGGSKEDTPVPNVVFGSIPPNKSDLLNLGVYLERMNGDKYLHMFWHRVQEPSGTTNMDFEFNQSSVVSGNGVTPVRTVGDVLIMYDLSNGGTNPTLWFSRWKTTGVASQVCEAGNKVPCWGKRVNLTASGLATGSINSVAIPESEAEGLGAISVRTFGEATVDFAALAGSGECVAFGSVYLKSRSSDSFSAELKDFIAPKSVSLSTCGTLKVIKTDDATPPALLAGATFELTGPQPATDTVSCTTNTSGECTFLNLAVGDYGLCETEAPTGHNLPSPACQDVTITADAEASVTFVDPRIPAKVNIHKQDDATPANPLSGAVFALYTDNAPVGSYGAGDTSTGKTCTTNASGNCTIDNILPPGDYCVVETTTPVGYDTAPAQCTNLALAEEVSLTFTDPRKRGAILITKTRKHAADGAGAHAHAGVTFTITGEDLPAAGVEVVTDAAGQACKEGLLLGIYSVTETVPAGYVADGAVTKTVTVGLANAGLCGGGNDASVSFGNTPLTNVTVSVDSQVVGGTKSTITCTGADPVDTGVGGDGSLTLSNLLPGTITCTILIDP